MKQADYREVREFIPQQVPLSQLLNNYTKQTVDEWVYDVIELGKFEYFGLLYSDEVFKRDSMRQINIQVKVLSLIYITGNEHNLFTGVTNYIKNNKDIDMKELIDLQKQGSELMNTIRPFLFDIHNL